MTVFQDVRFGLRFLRRNPSFAISAVGILALGIALSATLFAIVKGTLLEPWPYRGYERMVSFRANYPQQGRAEFPLWSAREVQDLRHQTDLFDDVIAGTAWSTSVMHDRQAEHVQAAFITPNAFAMLSVPALLGRTLDEGDGAVGASPVVVVSYEFWRNRLGGDPRVVGSILRLADQAPMVVGVMPAQFVFWDLDMWLPLALDRRQVRTDRRFYVQARLRQGLTTQQVQTRLDAFARRLQVDHPEIAEYKGLAISVNSLVEGVLRDLRPTLYILIAAVGLVLLVAASNIANAMLAKGTAREGDLAVRRALGATGLQIARQLLAEGALIGAGSAVLGACAASFLLPQLVSLIPYGYVPAEAHVVIDWRVLSLTAVAAIGCGLLLSVVPAIRAAATAPAALLRGTDTRTGSRKSHRWRDGFVVAQLVMAVVVLGIAVASAAHFSNLLRRDPGFSTAGVWTARVAFASLPLEDEPRASRYERLLQNLTQAPGVQQAAIASAFPVGVLPRTLVSLATASVAGRAAMDVDTIAVSPGFFDLLQIPIVDGRWFDEHDRAPAARVAIVTSSLAKRLWPRGGAVGSRLMIGDGSVASPAQALVVGVAGDVRPFATDFGLRPVLFEPVLQRPPAAVLIGIRSGDRQRLTATVSASVASVDPRSPVYRPATLEQLRIDTVGPQLMAAVVLGLFGVAVLILSAFGIFAVISQSVQERQQEIAIRLAFGADRRRLFVTEMMRVGRIVLGSVFGGSLAATGAIRLLSAASVVFPNTSAWPVGVALLAVGIIALGAAAIPTMRACRTELTSLKGAR